MPQRGCLTLGIDRKGAASGVDPIHSAEARIAERDRGTGLANAKVADLVDQARAALRVGQLDEARELLTAALHTPRANEFLAAGELLKDIQASTDSAGIRLRLVELTEEDFEAFRVDNVTPRILDFGFDALTSRALTLSKRRVTYAWRFAARS